MGEKETSEKRRCERAGDTDVREKETQARKERQTQGHMREKETALTQDTG